MTFRFCCVAIVAAMGCAFAEEKATPFEGELAPFLGVAKISHEQVFSGGRFPNIAIAADGTVLAVFGKGGVRVRRSEDGGKTWGEEIVIAEPGFMGAGVTVDENTGDVLAFVEERHPPAPVKIYRSKDHGKTWAVQVTDIKADRRGNAPSMHMNETGSTLRHGKHAGRLIRPSRYYGKRNAREEWPDHYTNAIYSDDGGKTWKTSDPFPKNGTGEACIVELSDGRIYYNSRRHWANKGENPRRRWTAWSDDGGHTWKDVAICEVLPDGDQDRDYGLMGGLVRLPVAGKDVLVFSNIVSPGGRHHGTVWASFDGGKTWPVKRLVTEGGFGYSSMAAGMPGTPGEGKIYLMFESGGAKVATFNLSWLVEGEPTKDGEIPDWAKK